MLDADSTRVTTDSTMHGLAGKFEREGYQGQIWFLQGGHAMLKAAKIKLVAEEDDIEAPNGGSKGFMAGKLGSLAFQQGEFQRLSN